jgi:hypothetical protein
VAHKKVSGLVTAAADYETRICATGERHKSNKLKSPKPQATLRRHWQLGSVRLHQHIQNSIETSGLADALAPTSLNSGGKQETRT